MALQHYRHYQAGFLPTAGGTANQNPFLMDCLAVIDRAAGEERAAAADSQERAAAQAVGGKRTGKPLGSFDGPLPGRRGFRLGWRSRLRPHR